MLKLLIFIEFKIEWSNATFCIERRIPVCFRFIAYVKYGSDQKKIKKKIKKQRKNKDIEI